jgi:acetyl esterase/lipase
MQGIDSSQAASSPRTTSSWRRWVLPAGAIALVSAALSPPAAILNSLTALQRYQVTTDLPYADGVRRKLDVYRPRDAAEAPVIVFFYGGSWQSGTKSMYRFLAATLAARGYVVVVPDYRLYPEVGFPDFLTDAALAVRWTHDNIAGFRGDPRRIFLMGHSAGAHIAAMLALDREWLNAAGLDSSRDIAGLIGISGPYDFLPIRDTILQTIFGGSDRPQTMPINFAGRDEPPALLLTGGDDTVVDPGNTLRLAAKLKRNGNDTTEVTYRRFGHMTILAAFAPLAGTFFRPMRDLDAFTTRIAPRPQHAAEAAPGAERVTR